MLLEITGVAVELTLDIDEQAQRLLESNFSVFPPPDRGRPMVQIRVEMAAEGR